MNYRLAKSLVRLREQVNAAYPDRDHESDGWIGDASHASRKSDHNPWIKDAKGIGVVSAEDFDENLTSPTGDAFNLVHALQASRDPRIKYIIYERQITVPGDITRWKPYHGPSPHDHHFHISVSSDPRLYDDASDWTISAAEPAGEPGSPTEDTGGGSPTASNPTSTEQPPILKRGSYGAEVIALQTKLRSLKYTLEINGRYDERTAYIVGKFQDSNHLDVDGMVGKDTRRALGL